MAIMFNVKLTTVQNYIFEQHGSYRQISADELAVVDLHAARMMHDIERGWPVDTSTSRDAFKWVLDENPLMISFRNHVFYAQYVHLRGTPPEPPLFETLIPRVARAHAPGLLWDMRAVTPLIEKQIEIAQAAGQRILQILAQRFFDTETLMALGGLA